MHYNTARLFQAELPFSLTVMLPHLSLKKKTKKIVNNTSLSTPNTIQYVIINLRSQNVDIILKTKSSTNSAVTNLNFTY